MLQTNCNSSNNSNSMDSDIVKRLEKLNKWQEEQKRMLNDRQNMQRQMLGLEQRNMYQMLGLLHPAEDDDVVVDDAADAMLENVGVNFGNKKDMKHKLCTDNEFKGIFSFETLEGVTKLSSQASSGKQVSTQNDLGLHPNMGPRLKQPFLRRGEGLKQRFKISPDALRLHNLPRYKYATNHPKIRNLQRQRFAPKAKPSQEDVRLRAGSEVMVKTKGTVPPSSRASTPMDMQEKQFQQVLMDSKHTCNSTPDEKNDKPAIDVMLPKVRFTEDAGDGRGQSSPCAEHYPEAVPLPSITWAKVLDSQQLRPINVQEMRAAGKHSERLRNKDAECAHSVDEGEDNLSIFELLERKACEGNIDMNSSCIKRFMERKRHRRPSELDESAAICVNECLTPVGLSPKVEVALRPDSSDEEHTQPEDNCSSTACETTKNSIDLSETTKNGASLLASVNKPAHVRFAEKTGMHEYSASHELLDSSSSLGEDTAEYNRRSSDLFHQFKDALFNALLGKGADGDNSNDMRLALQSPPSALTQELQEKSNLIRARLDELEKEIAAFRENNQQLLRAKQAHDLEREHFTQERIELMDRLKDDRIQMEIYLHDERMKMEEERRNFQQYMSGQRLAASNKDRKEIARLKQELEAMHLQQKQREQAHASAQARLRVQIRNMERDQQHLRDDIERLTKENKKLQSDKSKLERDSNTRMLHEINRNIAKLAPKLTTSALPTTEPARTIYNGTKKIHHKMSPPGGKTKGNFTPKSQRKFSAPPPSRCLSNIDVHGSTKEVASVQTADPHVEDHSSCDYDCNNNENDDGEDVETDEDSFDNELEVKQTQILNKSQPTQLAANTETEALTFSEKPAEQNEDPANSTDTNENFRREIVNADGSRDILYPNGNLKKISADGMNIRMLYFNKDIKETNVNEGTVRYYYAETNTWHTTYLDGLEILEFPNGQTEHRHKNGMVEVHFPDNSIKVTNPAEKNRLEEWRFADGTILIQMRNGDKILMLPNGQKEIHTKLNKRREYPDGTVKLVYPDGSQETRYSNGRVRLKDKDGHLVMDTESA